MDTQLSSSSTDHNVFVGLSAAFFLFLLFSSLALPDGIFTRPHPVLWRIVFGISVLYAMLLQVVLFQNSTDVKAVLSWFDPVGLGHVSLAEQQYAINCSDVSIERLWSYMDIFAVGHFFGWAMKALLIRHWIICWYLSIAWEVTEVFFAHLLPNFQECWWDAIFLDVILCNGLGILIGMQICKILEMRIYSWESIKNIRSTKGKLKRAVLQFTPESWIKVDWFNKLQLRRYLGIFTFIMFWLISELNTFFLKHVFAVDTSHPVVFGRIILIGVISAPSIRQYYTYVTDPRIKRLGLQSGVYAVVCLLELAICIKYGRDQLPTLKILSVVVWVIFLAFTTGICIWVSVRWAQHTSTGEKITAKMGDVYTDSCSEELRVGDADQDADDEQPRRRKPRRQSD